MMEKGTVLKLLEKDFVIGTVDYNILSTLMVFKYIQGCSKTWAMLIHRYISLCLS